MSLSKLLAHVRRSPLQNVASVEVHGDTAVFLDADGREIGHVDGYAALRAEMELRAQPKVEPYPVDWKVVGGVRR